MTWRTALDRGVQLHTIETARRVNDEMPDYACEVIRSELVKMGKDPVSATVAVLGVAFKSDTGDLRETPAAGVVSALRAIGADVRVFDPLADPAEILAQLGRPPADTLEQAVAGADCVAICAGHREFRDIDLTALRDQVAMPCLVFDGRMYYPAETIAELRGLGFAYRGIGR
jgi:UDP-N-acetyl-D-mannosaminuronic acid dehydrogenase